MTIQKLSKISPQFITSSELEDKLTANKESCVDENNRPVITLLDFRNEVILNPESLPPRIKTECRTINILLDDLLRKEIVDTIPRQGILITITETGSRDSFAIKYLSQFGFDNVLGLKFGMRDWIKNGYPVN